MGKRIVLNSALQFVKLKPFKPSNNHIFRLSASALELLGTKIFERRHQTQRAAHNTFAPFEAYVAKLWDGGGFMRISRKLAGAASLIAIASAFTFVQPSHANDLVDFFQNTLGVNVTNLRNPQAFARNHFQSKRSEIEANISYALSSGRISASQAASMRAELANIMNLEMAYSADGNLTMSEARTLSNKLASLDKKVDRYVATRPGGGYFPGGGFPGGGFDPRDPRYDHRFNFSITQVRNEINTLRSRVETGKMQRRLSINEYNLFKDRLNQQESKLNKMASSGGRFDQREFDRMKDALDKLENLIASALRTPNYPTAYGRYNDRWN